MSARATRKKGAASAAPAPSVRRYVDRAALPAADVPLLVDGDDPAWASGERDRRWSLRAACPCGPHFYYLELVKWARRADPTADGYTFVAERVYRAP